MDPSEWNDDGRGKGLTDASIGTVLEADGEGNTARQLSVKLRLGGAGTDSTPGDEVGDELGGDGIEEL